MSRRGCSRLALHAKLDQPAAQLSIERCEVEMLWVVVRSRDAAVDVRVKGRDQPASGTSTGEDVEQGQRSILRAGEARLRRDQVVVRRPGRILPPRLEALDVEEAAADGFADDPLELGCAPADLEIVSDDHPPEAVVEDVGYGVLAEELIDIAEVWIAIEMPREWPAADPRRAGVMNHEIERAAMVGGFRNGGRRRQRDGGAPQRARQSFLIDNGSAADERVKRRRQRLLRIGAAAWLDMAQKAARLGVRVAGKDQLHRIKRAFHRRGRGLQDAGKRDREHRQIAFELRREGETKISSIGRPNSSAMRKASGSEG